MKKITKKAFTMIEVIIGVFIFSLGLVSVFMLFGESSKLSVKSKNMIIATGLAREGVELVKNIRDSNYKKNIKFSWIPNDETDVKIKYKSSHLFTGTTVSGTYYKIENVIFDKSNSFLPIKIEKINVSDIGTKTDLENFQLCLDNDNIYYYCKGNSGDTKKTDFYRYINFKPAKIGADKIPDTFKVVSVVEWKKAGGGKVEIPFILADWKRQ